jgi:hypothetical protein
MGNSFIVNSIRYCDAVSVELKYQTPIQADISVSLFSAVYALKFQRQIYDGLKHIDVKLGRSQITEMPHRSMFTRPTTFRIDFKIRRCNNTLSLVHADDNGWHVYGEAC